MGAKLSVLVKGFAAKTEASCVAVVTFDVCHGSPVCDFIRLMLFFFFFSLTLTVSAGAVESLRWL